MSAARRRLALGALLAAAVLCGSLFLDWTELRLDLDPRLLGFLDEREPVRGLSGWEAMSALDIVLATLAAVAAIAALAAELVTLQLKPGAPPPPAPPAEQPAGTGQPARSEHGSGAIWTLVLLAAAVAAFGVSVYRLVEPAEGDAGAEARELLDRLHNLGGTGAMTASADVGAYVAVAASAALLAIAVALRLARRRTSPAGR